MAADIRISELLKYKRPLRSVEFFPPKDSEGMEQLMRIASTLKAIGPDFVSVTYGAGGSTRDRSFEVCRLLKSELGYTVMPHLTCVGSSRAELHDVLDKFYQHGFRNIMALRGDPPKGETTFQPAADGLRYASELVALIRSRFDDVSIGVAGYPEKHPEATDLSSDIAHLKNKVAQGADFITTQLFFNNDAYFSFVARCRAEGISTPIVPGIMPVLSFKQIQRFTQLCGSELPPALFSQLEQAGENAEAVEKIGVEWAATQIQGLLAHDAPGFHLYVLNRDRAALTLAQSLSR